MSTQSRPKLVTLIIIVNALGWLFTEGFWVFLHAAHKIPSIAKMHTYWERAYIGIVNGFSVADGVWSNLTLVVSIIGLWKMRTWGWLACMMANAIWVYTMTVSLVRDIQTGLTFGTIFFLSFALFSLWSTAYLWIKRDKFWSAKS